MLQAKVKELMMNMSYIAINRIVEERMATDKKYRKDTEKKEKAVLSFGKKMSDAELLEKLRSFHVILDKQIFNDLYKNFLSAEDMSKWLIKKQNLKFQGIEDDWIWICLTILWERWFPDRPSLEMIDDKMQEGYRKISENSCTGACEIWLEVWKFILNIMNSKKMKSLNDFDEKFRGTQSIFNWVQDLEMELGNAGAEDEKFIRDRILFCEEFISRFLHEDSLMIENMKRTLAESYSQIGEMERAESLYKKWLKDDPEWGWGWIGWSDCYWLQNRDDNIFKMAEKILKEGISIASVRDRQDIYDRLESLYSERGREKDAEEIRQKTNVLSHRIKNGLQKNQNLQKVKKIKVGRNDPCPCGSGKKFKKCCGKE
ncbi:MAG: SEC-C metal-binding domain-containing protein [bacterium]